MKQFLLFVGLLVVIVIAFSAGFFFARKYSIKTIQVESLASSSSEKLAALQLLRADKKEDAIMFLERQLAGQLAALQILGNGNISETSSNLSKISRIDGTCYFIVFPRGENASEVVTLLKKALEPSELSKDSFFTFMKERAEVEDEAFAKMLHEFNPNSSPLATQPYFKEYYSRLVFYKRIRNIAEQGAAANP